MSDHRPGDADILINGERRTLRLTLGALARLEESLGDGDFAALAKRLEAPRVADLLVILEALLHGGGERMTQVELRASDLDLADAAQAIARAFSSLRPEERSKAARHEGREGPAAILRDADLRPAPQDEGGTR
jgi:hypothetical protein